MPKTDYSTYSKSALWEISPIALHLARVAKSLPHASETLRKRFNENIALIEAAQSDEAKKIACIQALHNTSLCPEINAENASQFLSYFDDLKNQPSEYNSSNTDETIEPFEATHEWFIKLDDPTPQTSSEADYSPTFSETNPEKGFAAAKLMLEAVCDKTDGEAISDKGKEVLAQIKKVQDLRQQDMNFTAKLTHVAQDTTALIVHSPSLKQGRYEALPIAQYKYRLLQYKGMERDIRSTSWGWALAGAMLALGGIGASLTIVAVSLSLAGITLGGSTPASSLGLIVAMKTMAASIKTLAHCIELLTYGIGGPAAMLSFTASQHAFHKAHNSNSQAQLGHSMSLFRKEVEHSNTSILNAKPRSVSPSAS